MKLLFSMLVSLAPFWLLVTSQARGEEGGIAGRVVFEGLRPATLAPLDPGPLLERCSALAEGEVFDATDRSLLLDADSGGVANVVVTVRALEEEQQSVPAGVVDLLMDDARFEPHVVVVPAGGSLRFENRDGGNHNPHTYSRKNAALNRSLASGESFEVELKHPEVFNLRDDLHPWMEAFVVVTDASGWAVSGVDGSFALGGLAPGKYALSWWHETLGRGRVEELVVAAGGTTPLDLKVSLRFDVLPASPDLPSGRDRGAAKQPVDAQVPVPDEAEEGAENEAPTAPAQPETEGEARVPAPASGTGHVQLRAHWKGTLPEPKPLLAIGETEAAGCVHHGVEGVDPSDRTLLVDATSRGIENVVFFLEGEGVPPLIPEEPIRFDQSGCRFEPHVLVVPIGSQLAYANSDQTNHNVHTYARKNTPLNSNVAAGDQLLATLERAETFEVKCDIHPWMRGYVVVTEASRAGSTSSAGSLLLRDVAPGTYSLSWWHESLGKGKLGEVEVVAGQVTSFEHELSASSGGGSRRRRR